MRGFARNNVYESLSLAAGDLVAQMPAGVAVVDADNGEFLYTNDCWDRLFGYGPGEVLGRHVAAVNAATEATPEARSREIFDALARDGSWSGEVHNVRKDGSHFWTSCSICGMERLGRGPTWLVVQTDISDRRAGEERLLQSEQTYRRLFESSPSALAMIDRDLRLTLVNEAFADIVGYRREDLQGKRLPDLTHPDDIASCSELRKRVLSGETAHYRLEERLLTRQGGVVSVALSATVLRSPDGIPEVEIAVIEMLKPSRP